MGFFVGVEVGALGEEGMEVNVCVAGKNTNVFVGVGGIRAGVEDAAGAGEVGEAGGGRVSRAGIRVGTTAPGVRKISIQTGWVRMEGASG